MKTKHYLLLATVATMFAACTSEELAPAADAMTDKPVTVSGANITSATTRNDATTTALTEGSLGLFFDTPNVEDTKYDAENREVTYTEGKWVISGTPLLWINAGTNVNYAAYYPYNANGYSTITVPTNQNEEGEFTKADFLYGSGTAKAGDNNGAINIILAHQMSKLTVIFNITDEVKDATIHSVTIDGCLVSRTFDASATENKWGTVETNAATTVVRMSEAEESSYKCIILPQDATNHTINVALTQGNKERVFKHTLTSQEFESNKAYTLTLKLGHDATAVGTVQVKEWDTTDPLKTDEMAEANGYTYDETQKTFTVNTAEGLQEVMNLVNGTNSRANSEDYKNANITLGADIILPTVAEGESNLTPIAEYSGTFDGAGYSIKGLTVVGKGLSVETGHFGGIVNKLQGTIKNLTLTNCTIEMDETYSQSVGAIAGISTNGTIDDCHINGTSTISGNKYVGAIVGLFQKTSTENENVTIKDCTVKDNVTITGARITGGIVGHVGNSSTSTDNGAPITNCEVSDGVNISGGSCVGGIAGATYDISTIVSDCTVKNNVTITGTTELTSDNGFGIGGIIGQVYDNSIVKNCKFLNSTINAKGDRIGGIAGFNGGYVMGCTAQNSSLTGAKEVGGIVGQSWGYLIIASYAKEMTLKKTDENMSDAKAYTVGGIVGYNGGITTNKNSTTIGCYAYNCKYDKKYQGDDGYMNVVNYYDFATHASTATLKFEFTANYYNVSGEQATPVTVNEKGYPSSDTAVDWSKAVSAMNDAIKAWNDKNTDNTCAYKWKTGTTNSTAELVSE